MSPFFLHLSPNTEVKEWKGLLVINVSALASSEVIPTVMHVPSPCRIQFYLSQTMGFLHLEKTTPQLNGWSQLAFQSWPRKQYCPMEGQIPKPRMVGKEKGTEKKMRREVGSKPPTSCNAILFKSNTVRNPQSPPLDPQLRAPSSGCDLKRNNTKVTQLHPSA